MRFQRVRVKILKKTGCESLNCSCPVVVAGPGDVFGELALLYNCPRAASVEAGGRPSILMYFASVWIRLLVVDSWHQTLAAPTARKATEEAVVWQLDRETFSHIVRDASAKRREAFQDFLNLGKAWRGVSRSSYVVGSWNNGVSEIARMCSWMFVTCTQLLLAHIAFMACGPEEDGATFQASGELWPDVLNSVSVQFWCMKSWSIYRRYLPRQLADCLQQESLDAGQNPGRTWLGPATPGLAWVIESSSG